jgi:hypothetical protein
MTSQLVVAGVVFVLLASVFAFMIDPGARESAAVSAKETPAAAEEAEGGAPAERAPAEQAPAEQPAAAPQAPVASPSNRANCDQIRGTQYLSIEERDWYRANCR